MSMTTCETLHIPCDLMEDTHNSLNASGGSMADIAITTAFAALQTFNTPKISWVGGAGTSVTFRFSVELQNVQVGSSLPHDPAENCAFSGARYLHTAAEFVRSPQIPTTAMTWGAPPIPRF